MANLVVDQIGLRWGHATLLWLYVFWLSKRTGAFEFTTPRRVVQINQDLPSTFGAIVFCLSINKERKGSTSGVAFLQFAEASRNEDFSAVRRHKPDGEGEDCIGNAIRRYS